MSKRSRQSRKSRKQSGKSQAAAGQQSSSPKSSNPLAALPDEQKQEIIAEAIERNPELLQTSEVRAAVMAVAKSHSGPLPAPEDYAAYERACPGSGLRILGMAELAQNSMIALNERRIDGDLAEGKRGQLCALVIALAGLAAGSITAVMGAPAAVSIALGGAPLAMLIAPFFRRRDG
ncbi:DUF2335 domain-containing protein [Luteimonas sp. RIT-PG2_3]